MADLVLTMASETSFELIQQASNNIVGSTFNSLDVCINIFDINIRKYHFDINRV